MGSGGYQRRWEWNSHVLYITSDFACNSRGAKHFPTAALAYGSAQLGHHWLAEYDGRGLIFPSFFLLSSFDSPPALTRRNLLAIIHAAGILITIILVVSYLSSSMLPVSSSTSYSLHRIVQLPTVSVPLRAVLTISRSSMIFSPRLSRYSLPPASSPPSSSTSYSSLLA